MDFLTRNFHDLFNALPEMNCNFQKPATCPHCGKGGDFPCVSTHWFSNHRGIQIVFLVMQCSFCGRFLTATYQIEKGKSCVLGIAPKSVPAFYDEHIEQMSPRFVETYNQALRAKDNGDFSLAAIGFRASLEILVKDYAIVELHKDVKNVSGKTLYDAISEYLPAKDLTKMSDVVRILGNDYAHYSRKYPEYDFALLDEYMNLFISLVKAQLLINHPPVSR